MGHGRSDVIMLERSPRWSIPVILSVAGVALFAGLGASRLSYHEAIWAETGREMVVSGGWLVPTMDGRPWLEKPPMGTWLIAASSLVFGGVTEAAARFPSALAALGVCLGVASLASRRFGPRVGLYAGLIQGTMLWAVLRGRLAEVDIVLAAMIVGCLLAFDRVREGSNRAVGAFFVLIGLTAMAKGIGFGAALVGGSALAAIVWDRDRAMLGRLLKPSGMAAAILIAMAWPLGILGRHPEALRLWLLHVTDRVAAHPTQFASEPWGEYLLSPLWQTLPWTPLALHGAWLSLRKAGRERGGPDRLLWAWAVVPAVLVSMASVRNGHYLLPSLPPWSIWAAIGLDRLRERRGMAFDRHRVRVAVACGAMAAVYAIGFAVVAPRLDHRSAESSFYRRAGRLIDPNEPMVLLYDDWDRRPYPSPFGPVPHDLAIRLYYLDRPAEWRDSPGSLAQNRPTGNFAVLGRDRDLPSLQTMGRVDVVERGPVQRARFSRVDDRAYVLFRVTPAPRAGRGPVASRYPSGPAPAAR